MKTKEITENMELDQSPFFRRIITPWYDSDPVCWVLFISYILLLVFALIGMEIAISNPDLNGYVWFPSMLAGLVLVLMVSVIVRIVRHNIKD